MDIHDAWQPVDPLGEALHFLRMSGVFYCRSELSAPWGVAVPPLPGCLMFHVVTRGQCLLEVAGAQPQWLAPGEFTLVPHGAGHDLSSGPGAEIAPLFDLPREEISERYETLRHGGGGVATTLICGAVRFDHPAAHHLVGLLPPVVRTGAPGPGEPDWVASLLGLMASEARSLQPGGETLITRLADILVVQAVRRWMAEDPAARTGWLGALQDGRIGRAIALVHRDPGRAWTVAQLADAVAMSRSAFAERFTARVGEPAMRYVARWRMHVALTTLREEGARLGDLAARLGYESEAAFSRSFKRHTGMSPGAARMRPTERWPQPPNKAAGRPATASRTANSPPASGSAAR